MDWKYPKRVAVLVIGITVITFGAALLFLPGPGLAIMVAGLALLATEFLWAKRLLTRIKDRAVNVGNAVMPSMVPRVHDSASESDSVDTSASRR